MKDHLLFIGSTGVLGRGFCETQTDRFDITGISRRLPDLRPPLMPHIRSVRADVTRCNWGAVLKKAEGDLGKPKHIVYSVFNRFERFDWKDAPDWFIDTEINLHVTSLLKLVRELFTYWDGTEGNTLTIVSSMAAVKSVKPDLFSYAAAKIAQTMIVQQSAMQLTTAKTFGLCPNSFPAKYATQDVVNAILNLLDNGTNGQIVKMP